MIGEDTFTQAEERMKKTIENIKKEFVTIRTGRASPALLDKVMVECYGSNTPLKQVANIAVPEARMIIVHPWDRSIIGSVEKALQKADLGINPVNDGKIIRLVIPPLTEERRKDLVKVVKKKTEEGRVAVRNIRRDIMEELKKMEKDGVASEDEAHRAQDRIQKLTDRFIDDLQKLQDGKEKEIMEI